MYYYGRNNSRYTLGNELGKGGEGSVYEINENRNLVAKIYLPQKLSSVPNNELKEKIETMLEQPVAPYIYTPSYGNVLTIAWPVDILFDTNHCFAGYVMPRVNSTHKIFAASRERERTQLFNNYSWKTAICISLNLALAVKKVHEANAEVGDMNPNNIMIDEHGFVTLIDTDSFNITNRRTGKVYKCSVGVPEVLPPELQGKNLADPNSRFTRHTDEFALAIHIFNLLMNNCHPFGCIGLNKSQSSSSNCKVASNITKGACPYVSSVPYKVSPAAPDFMMLTPEIRKLFERAFAYDVQTAVKFSTISKRPSAKEWQETLYRLYMSDTKKCRRKQVHIYPSHNHKCPWCEIERRKGTGNWLETLKAKFGKNSKISGKNGGKSSSAGIGNRLWGPAVYGQQRSPGLLWGLCILSGVAFSPLLAKYWFPVFNQLILSIFELDLRNFMVTELGIHKGLEGIICILYMVIGAIVGGITANCFQYKYKKANIGWPLLFISLAVPFFSIIASLLLAAAIGIVALLLILFFYILVFVIILSMFFGG